MPKTAARAPGARRPAPVDLRVRPRRHPHRPDRPAGPGGDGVPRRQRLQAHDHLAQVRPQRLHHRRGNVSEHSTGDAMDIAEVNGIPILGNQGRGSITEARARDPAAAPGHDAAAPADLADEPWRAVVRDGRPRRPHPRRVLPDGARRPGREQAVRPAPEAGPVAAADRADRQDRQPEGAHLAVALLDPARASASTTRSAPAPPTAATSGATAHGSRLRRR